MKSAFKCMADVLQALTLGKYRTSFYFKNKQDHTTIVGSIITILVSIFVGYLSFDVMRSIYNREDFTV